MSQTNPWRWEEPLLLLEPVQDLGLVLALGDPRVLSSLLLPGKEQELPQFPGISSSLSNTCSSTLRCLGLPSPCPSQRTFPACISPGVLHPGMSNGNGVPGGDTTVSAALCEQGTFPAGMGMGSAPRAELGCTGEAQAAVAPHWARLCPLQVLPGWVIPAPCQGLLLWPGSVLIQLFSLESTWALFLLLLLLPR